MPDIRVEPVDALHPGLERLREAAVQEGFRFLERLAEEWASGANRFGADGEALRGAFRAGRLTGVCGLNRDPYLAGRERVGRLRHLYVLPGERRRGTAGLLVRDLLADARAHFDVVRLRTATPDAAAFYAALGFTPVAEPAATHRLVL